MANVASSPPAPASGPVEEVRGDQIPTARIVSAWTISPTSIPSARPGPACAIGSECPSRGAFFAGERDGIKGASGARMASPINFVGSLDAYRHSIARFPQLSVQLERALASRYRAGDQRAGEQLIHACLPFVLMIAREYRCWGVPMEDIVQQGNLGLLKAAARFDPARECRLVTYAAYWVRAEIREFVVRGYRIVRLGTTKSERRALRAYRRTRETDPALLAQMSGLDREAVERIL